MLKAIFGYQMKLTVNLTVKMLLTEKTSIGDNGLQVPLMSGSRNIKRDPVVAITMYGIKNCDTVKKARSWLEAQGVEYRFHDYKLGGIDRRRLEAWCGELGWEALLNRAGTTFRKLPDTDKQAIDARKAVALMLAQPSLIKRPVLDLGRRRLVGFKPELYETALRAGR